MNGPWFRSSGCISNRYSPSSDIKKQLPTESLKFAEVDAHWRILMKETQ